MLSDSLIQELIKSEISICGIDFCGIKRPEEHSRTNIYLKKNRILVVENLVNLGVILDGKKYNRVVFYTSPIKLKGISGLPVRVFAEIA